MKCVSLQQTFSILYVPNIQIPMFPFIILYYFIDIFRNSWFYNLYLFYFSTYKNCYILLFIELARLLVLSILSEFCQKKGFKGEVYRVMKKVKLLWYVTLICATYKIYNVFSLSVYSLNRGLFID